jgi:type I restriction enzyme S subunit
LKPKFDKVNPYYLKYIINSPYVKRQADKRIRGIGVPDLHLIEIKQFTIPLPPLDKQKEFLEAIMKINEILERHKSRSNYSNDLINALMSKAFTGELVA